VWGIGVFARSSYRVTESGCLRAIFIKKIPKNLIKII
jgi:hypothetical protein